MSAATIRRTQPASRIRIPAGPAAVLRSLRFGNSAQEACESLTEAEWQEALNYADRQHLTLYFAKAVAPYGPLSIQERFSKNLEANRQRIQNLLNLYREIKHRFESANVEHLVLKGFTNYPDFCSDPNLRMQYDLDVYCPRNAIEAARDEAITLGFEPITGGHKTAIDHLPTLIRKTGWQWKGDYFDVEIPFAVELHFRFWDRETERFGPADLDEFWRRRDRRRIENTEFPALSRVDALAYACLHALRHLLRGDLRPSHAYEIAWFLEHHQQPDFWRDWHAQHSPELRQMQAICFRIAEHWFPCAIAPEAAEAIDQLPIPIQDWMERFAYAPLESAFHPNKNELWLHLQLLSTLSDRLAVARRRLLPVTLPGPVDAAHIPESELTWSRRLQKQRKYAAYLGTRFTHHASVLAPAVWSGAAWYSRGVAFPRQLWLFFGIAALFNAGAFIFFLLYNLYLLDKGFAEDFLGYMTSAFTAGSLAGSLLGGYLAAKAGPRKSLLVCFSGTAVVFALRAAVLERTALIALATLGGAFLSLWAICLSPVVAHFTNDRNRPAAFSFTFASGIAVGVIAGLAGARLPDVLRTKQNALFFGCALMFLAALALTRLRFGAVPEAAKRVFSFNPFLVRFLAAMALWSAATGAFNPFFSVYLAKVAKLGTDQVGQVFAVAQLVQVCALLAAPLLLRRFGTIAGIAAAQAATAFALIGLGAAPVAFAVWMYTAYMACQYMTEPGMYTLLMSRVSPEQRQGASSLNFIVMFAGQAVAASAAGAAITKVGYAPVLYAAGLLALLAAGLIAVLLREESQQ